MRIGNSKIDKIRAKNQAGWLEKIIQLSLEASLSAGSEVLTNLYIEQAERFCDLLEKEVGKREADRAWERSRKKSEIKK